MAEAIEQDGSLETVSVVVRLLAAPLGQEDRGGFAHFLRAAEQAVTFSQLIAMSCTARLGSRTSFALPWTGPATGGGEPFGGGGGEIGSAHFWIP